MRQEQVHSRSGTPCRATARPSVPTAQRLQGKKQHHWVAPVIQGVLLLGGVLSILTILGIVMVLTEETEEADYFPAPADTLEQARQNLADAGSLGAYSGSVLLRSPGAAVWLKS